MQKINTFRADRLNLDLDAFSVPRNCTESRVKGSPLRSFLINKNIYAMYTNKNVHVCTYKAVGVSILYLFKLGSWYEIFSDAHFRLGLWSVVSVHEKVKVLPLSLLILHIPPFPSLHFCPHLTYPLLTHSFHLNPFLDHQNFHLHQLSHLRPLEAQVTPFHFPPSSLTFLPVC